MALTVVRVRAAMFRASLVQHRWLFPLFVALSIAVVYIFSFPLRVVSNAFESDIDSGVSAVITTNALIGVCASLVAVVTEPFSPVGMKELRRFGMGRSRLLQSAAVTHSLSPQVLIPFAYFVAQFITLVPHVPLQILIAASVLSMVSTSLCIFLVSVVPQGGRVALRCTVSLLLVYMVFVFGSIHFTSGDDILMTIASMSPFGAGWRILDQTGAWDVIVALLWPVFSAGSYPLIIRATQQVGAPNHSRSESHVTHHAPSWVFKSDITAIGWRQAASYRSSPRFWADSALVFLVMIMVAGLYLGLVSQTTSEAVGALIVLLAFGLSMSGYNAIGFDGTKAWVHLVSSVKGLRDVIGRSLPGLVFGVLVAVVGSLASCLAFDCLRIFLPSVAVSVSAVFLGVGVSSITSVLTPFQTHSRDDSRSPDPYRELLSSFLVVLLSIAALVPLLVVQHTLTQGGLVSVLALTLVAPPASALALVVAAKTLDRKAHRRFAHLA